MAIQNETFGFTVRNNTTGVPLSGALVELRKGATIYTLTEKGTSGFYEIASIPTGKYSVFINSVDAGSTMAVGAGQVAALGNEVDNIAVSTATEYTFQDPTEYKTTLSLENVTNVAVPDPIAADANKVISVDSNGDYELKTISTSGFDAIFEVATTSDLVEALSAEYESKMLIITNRDDFYFQNNQTFEVYGYCNIFGAGGSNGITFTNDTGTTITFNNKAGAPANTAMVFYLSRVQFNDTFAASPYLNYAINSVWWVTNLNFTEGGTDTIVISGTGSILYENLEAPLPTNVTVSTAQAWWNNSSQGGGSQDLEETLVNGETTGANKITFEDFVNALKTDGDLWKEGGYLNVEGLFRVFGNLNLGESVSSVTGQLVTILKNTDLNGYVEVAGGQGTTTGGAFRMYGNAASASLANKTIFYGGIGLATSFNNTNPQESNIWKQSTDGRHKLIENGQEVFLKSNFGVTSDGSELNNNLDTTRRMDMYRVDTTWTGSPYTAGAFENQGYVFHQDYNANFAIQIHTSLDINFPMKKRTKNSGTWSAWGDVATSGSKIKFYPTFNVGNITGNCTQSGVYQATLFEPSSDIDVNYLEVDCSLYSSASTATIAVYDEAGTTQLASGTVAVSSTGVKKASITTLSLIGGTRYWLAMTDTHGSNSYGCQSFSSAPSVNYQRSGTATGSFGSWGLPTSISSGTATTSAVWQAVSNA